MADNIGLGEAIAGQTRATGDWGAPVTRGLQMAEARDMKKMQLDQQKAYKQQQEAEKMAKYISDSNGKFHNAKYQKQFGDAYMAKLPELLAANKAGDIYKEYELKTSLNNDLGRLKMMDEDEHVINTALQSKTATAGTLRDVYNSKGVAGILEHNANHIVPIADVDAGGKINPNTVQDPHIEKVLDYYLSKSIPGVAKKVITGSVNGMPQYQVDENSKEFGALKNDVLGQINRPGVIEGVMASANFKKFFEDYHEKTGIPYDILKDENMERPAVIKKFLESEFNNAVSRNNNIKFAPTPSKGKGGGWDDLFLNGKDSGFTFFKTPSGVIHTDNSKTTGITVKINGRLSDGSEVMNMGLVIPDVEYLGNDKFAVTGRKEGETFYMPLTRLIVDKDEIKARYNLSDKGLVQNLGYIMPKPAAKGKPKGSKKKLY